MSERLANVYPILFEQRYKLGATLALVGRHDLGYKWLRSLYKSGFEGDDTFYYWLAASAYGTGRTEFAETIWKKAEAEFPESDRPAPWAERQEPLPASLEQRLAAYYISSAEGERNQLEKVLTAKRAVSPFEQDFVRLLLSGEKGASGVSGDALFTYRTVKLLEKAEADSLKLTS